MVALLDGQASTDLRRLVPLAERRELGAFFTPSAMAAHVAEPLSDGSGDLVVVDPSCGAGDLLLAAVRQTAVARGHEQATLALYGIDIVPTFVDAANARVRLQCDLLEVPSQTFFRCGDGANAAEIGSATHILTNPPFGPTNADDGCTWASGRIHRAASFFVKILEAASPGTVVRALLPDVLRCGRRYEAWRRHVDDMVDVVSADRLGRFDRWTDIDVFLLSARVEPASANVSKGPWIPFHDGPTVAEGFSVNVGAVVNYRDPHRGAWAPYLTAKGFPTWQRVACVLGNRRFTGRLDQGPFVAIPRTSRPGEPHRARGALVSELRQVAVDNHLLIAKPHSGRMGDCEALLRLLKRPETTEWLNGVNGCRHLTVGAIKSIPWIDDE